MAVVQHRFVESCGIKTHYLEAGEGPPVVLLHSGEFGACAELSWEFNIGPLSRHFRVIAPDWLGFGQSSKVFSFDDMPGLRIRAIAELLHELDISRAHFVGNSMGGGLLARAAVGQPSPLPIGRMVLVGAGGVAPVNDARETLNGYDGSLEHMRRIVETLVRRPGLRDDPDYLDRRHRLSLIPGTWEATAAARMRMPGRDAPAKGKTPFGNIAQPTLIIAGAHDPLRERGFGLALHKVIQGSDLEVFSDSGHCPQIDEPERFNRVVIDYLSD